MRPSAARVAVMCVALGATLALSEAASAARLAPVGKPVVGALEPTGPRASAEVAVTVRNDSGRRGRMRVSLVLDDGTVARLRKRRVDSLVGDQRISIALRRRGQRPLAIDRRGVRRVKLVLLAEPMPKQALAGTLVIGLANAPRVSPLATRISAAKETTASRFAKAKPQPAGVTMIVRRWLPTPLAPKALIVDRQDVDVQGIGGGEAIATGQELANAPVSADTGGRGDLVLEASGEIDADDADGRVTIDAARITQNGEYEAKLPLDPDAEGSPTIDVKVVARDLFVWPLLAILLGTALAYRQLRRQEEKRPKDVLRLALQRLKETHEANAELSGPQPPYKLDAFPSSWDGSAGDQKEAHKLWRRIDQANLQEDLDGITKEIADLDARVRAWPLARAKAKRLKDVIGSLPQDDLADRLRKASRALLKRDPSPADEAATTAYLKELDGQVVAIQTWVSAYEMYEEAARLHTALVAQGDPEVETLRTHNPARWKDDLAEAEDADDLARCGVEDALCRDLHLLRSLSLTDPPPPEEPEARGSEEAARARALAFELTTRHWSAALELNEQDRENFAQLVRRIRPRRASSLTGTREKTKVAGPAREEPAASVSARLLEGLQAGDRRDFKWAFGIATVIYFATIYDATYGSALDYVSAIAAGAGGAYATNFKLLPWFRSYRPGKPS